MATDKTDLGDRMKMYENSEAKRKFTPLLPICVRLDGRGFSKFTKGLARPYDIRLSDIMKRVTEVLVNETNACIGYTQSDEISLVLYNDNPRSQVYFNGRIQKINTSLASLASVVFNKLIALHIPEKAHIIATFDCRSWVVPNKAEAANSILWRELDATKNSISMLAHTHFSHKSLHGLNGKQMKDKLINEIGINWNQEPTFFKRGTFLQRRKVTRAWTAFEVRTIKAKNPKANIKVGDVVERHDILELGMPPFNRVTNRVEVVFEGEQPMVGE
jgi:tRNA(His) guanylyltransferase